MGKLKNKNPYQGANEARCCICGAIIKDGGHNPAPIESREGARCCKKCNEEFVIPARARQQQEDEFAPYERAADFLKIMELEQMFQIGRAGESIKTIYCTKAGGHTYRVTKKVIRIN